MNINKSGLALLETLKAFADVDREASLADMAILMGQPKQTVHRALATLLSSGFVEQDPVNRKYRLGTAILGLSSALLRDLDVRQVAQAPLKGLSQATGETVTLAVRSGHEIVFVDRFDGRHNVRFYCEIGKRLPLHIGAAAKAMLAAIDDEGFEDYLDHLRSVGAAHTTDSVDVESVRRQRDLTRRRGYSYSEQDVDRGVFAVGAAILDHRGRPAGSVAVATLAQQLSEDEIAPLAVQVQQTAQEISRRLGFQAAQAVKQAV